MKNEWDIVIAGGGFFGCSIAIHLAEKGKRVLLCERETKCFQRASYHNQARVHNGYHYPRSILTALRSRVNFPRFIEDFTNCIDSSFDHYYAVPRIASKVSARQFRLFMERIEASVKPAPKEIQKLFNKDLIEDVFLVTEYAFDAVKLKTLSESRMEKAGVTVWKSSEVGKVSIASEDRLELHVQKQGDSEHTSASQVLNCTYSHLNLLLEKSSLSRIRLKQEITEMALVEPPEELQDKAVTVMCGPFFSTMPFPSLGKHTLSHVRYTPHCSWMEGPDTSYQPAFAVLEKYPKKSRFDHMKYDAMRYLPVLKNAKQTGSLWEVKTVLPQSEVDDSRPILFQKCPEIPNLINIMGGKIDNIYDVYDALDLIIK